MEKRLNNNVLPEVSEVDLIFRSKVKASLRPEITDPDDAYELLIRTWDKEKLELLEQFKVLLLNIKGRVLGIYEASSGGIAGTVADSRIIFAAALKAKATSIIIAHKSDEEPASPDYPTGQVGSAIVNFLVEKKADVKAVIRDVKKVKSIGFQITQLKTSSK